MIDVSLRVVPILSELRWEPNAPAAHFSATDDGLAVLTLRAHFDDSDQRSVAIFWTGVSDAFFGDPNDEGRDQHALYSSGLSGLRWAGEVLDDEGSSDRRRFIIPTKEATAEVRARSIHVTRVAPLTTADDVLRLARSHASGVAWPDRRLDVIEALRRLASISPLNLDEWPDLTNAVRWLVDDTHWDQHSPNEEIGFLLTNVAEAEAVEAVVRPLVHVLELLGPVSSDVSYVEHAEWPTVAALAASAFDHLSGEVGG